MPDYDLGRAHGSVVITADTTGAQRGMAEYEKSTKSVTSAIADQNRIEQELTKRRDEAERALQRRKNAENEYKSVMKDSNSTLEQQIEAELKRNSARGEADSSTRRLTQAENAYRSAVDGNTDAVRKFISALDGAGSSHDRATGKMRDWRSEINETDRTLKVLSSTITKTFGVALKIAGGAAAGGAAGGLLGLLGGGGVQGIVSITEAVKDMSGAILLAPAAIGGLATVFGTLAVSMNGVSDALSAMDDPAKFAKALQQLAPAAAQAVTIIAGFEQAFKGAMQQIQQSFFEPLVGQIRPLVYQWLPLLMSAGKQVASVLGQAGEVIAQWLQQPAAQAGFTEFINNLVQGLKQMLPAIKPIADAFLTLTRVGSQFFPEIADSITKIANAFNAWVQGASHSGQLQQWIQTALTSFGQLFQIINNVFQAFGNIGALADKGGGLLTFLVNITQSFKAWTESAKGAELITAFFNNMKAASDVLGPILKIVGEAILVLFNNLAQLGVQSGSGITSFFQSIATALDSLGQSLISSGPALGDILKAVGDALLQMVQGVGPSLPSLFTNLAQAAVELTPVLVTIAKALGDVLSHLTPTEIEWILGFIVAVQGISVLVPIVTSLAAAFTFLGGPVTLAIAAGVALAAGIIYLVAHYKDLGSALSSVWGAMQQAGSWIASTFVGIWNSLANAVVGALKSIGNFGSEILESLAGAWSTVTNAVAGWYADAYEWGSNIVNRLIDGIKSMFGPLSDAWDWLVGKGVKDKNPSSPPKTGPLSGQGDPLVSGRMVSQRFAEGISSGAPAVSSAYDTAIGTGNQQFSSAGVSGTTSKGGQSGFDQWIKGLTTELSAWSSIGKNLFGLLGNVADMFVDTTKIVASLWNKGDNPLTRPGGIAGKPLTPQEQVNGVPSAEQHGTAPLPNLVPHGANGATAVPQEGVPGVPSAAAPGSPTTPGSNSDWFHSGTGTPPANPPASTAGQAPPAVQGQAGPVSVNASGFSDNQKQIAGKIISEGRKRGMNDQQIQAALTIAGGESNFGDNAVFNTSGGNASVGGVGGVFQQAPKYYGGKDNVMNPDIAIPAFFDKYATDLKSIPDPLQAAIHVQNPQLGVNNLNSQYANQVRVRSGDASALLAGSVQAPIVPVPGGPGIARGPGQLAVSGQRELDQGTGLTRDPSAPGYDLSSTDTPIQPNRTSRVIPSAADTSGQPYGLKTGTNTGGYGTGSDKYFPQWVLDLGDQYGVKPSTYAGHQETDRGTGPNGVGYAPNPNKLNRGVDWVGTPEAMESFAKALVQYGGAEGSQGALEQVIYQAGPGGKRYGLGGAGNVNNVPHEQGGYYPQDDGGRGGSYNEHGGDGGPNAHVHTRFSRSFSLSDDGAAGIQQGAPTDVRVVSDSGASVFGSAPTAPGVQIPQGLPFIGGAQQNSQVPPGIAYKNGQLQIGPGAQLGSGVQGTYDPSKPLVGPGGQVAPSIYNQLLPRNPVPGAGTGGANAFAPPDASTTAGGTSTKSPLDQLSSGLQSVSSIAGDSFKIFDDVIKNISAVADIGDTLARGPENTEDISKVIDNIQTFITTGADVAKLVGDVGGIVAGVGGADPTGMSGAGAIGAAIQAISGVVQSALEATNAGIDLGQEVYHQLAKYGAMIAAFTLGNSQTGPLGGNVRMLLNTNTGQVIDYSEDNPDNKAVHNLPSWFSRAYGGANPNAQPNTQTNQLNMYVGPGGTPMQMMQDSMWLISTGAPSVASVAGAD